MRTFSLSLSLSGSPSCPEQRERESLNKESLPHRQTLDSETSARSRREQAAFISPFGLKKGKDEERDTNLFVSFMLGSVASSRDEDDKDDCSSCNMLGWVGNAGNKLLLAPDRRTKDVPFQINNFWGEKKTF